MSKPASFHIPTASACQQVLPVKHRLATKEGQPAHMAAASFSHTHSKGGPPSGLSTGHEPVRLSALGRARAGGFLNGSLPGSAAAAAVVNLYTGHPGISPASLCQRAWHANSHADHQLCGIGAFTCAATLHGLTRRKDAILPHKASQEKILGQCGYFGHCNMFALFCDNRQRRHCSHIQAKPTGYRPTLSHPPR